MNLSSGGKKKNMISLIWIHLHYIFISRGMNNAWQHFRTSDSCLGVSVPKILESLCSCTCAQQLPTLHISQRSLRGPPGPGLQYVWVPSLISVLSLSPWCCWSLLEIFTDVSGRAMPSLLLLLEKTASSSSQESRHSYGTCLGGFAFQEIQADALPRLVFLRKMLAPLTNWVLSSWKRVPSNFTDI